MNVRPGILAIVVSSKPHYNGRIVEVLYAAEGDEVTLPNGETCIVTLPGPNWVVKAVGAPLEGRKVGGARALCWYGVGQDKHLRPLPGDPQEPAASSSEASHVHD